MDFKNSRADQFSTPVKSRGGFMNSADAFATPSSVFNARFGSNMQSPYGQTPSRVPEHDSSAPNLYLLTTDEIPTIPRDVSIIEIKKNVTEAFSPQSRSNWLNKVEAITILRALNKTYPEEIFDVFMLFGDQIVASLSMKVPLIHKSILAFIYEVLTVKRKKPLEEAIIERLIPILLNRSRSSSQTIRKMAKESLKEISQTLICNGSLMKFAELALDKNLTMAELAFRGLAVSIDYLGENINQINTRTLQGIFVVFAKIIFHKRAASIKVATDGARYLQRLMGFENYTRMLEILIDEKHITLEEGNNMVTILNNDGNAHHRDRFETRRDVVEMKHSMRKQRMSKEPIIEVLPDKVTAQKANSYDRGANFGGCFFNQGGYQQSHFR